MLADGDVVTFGKTVGRDEFLVPPVTARVKLVFSSDELSSPFPTFAPPDTPESSERASPKSSTGRYGVLSSSSDSSCSTSDSGSEIEEISRPSSPLPTTSAGNQPSDPRVGSHSSDRLELLRRLLPPIHSPMMSGASLRSTSPDVGGLTFLPKQVEGHSSKVDMVGCEDLGAVTDPNIIGAWPESPGGSDSPSSSDDSSCRLLSPAEYDGEVYAAPEGHVINCNGQDEDTFIRNSTTSCDNASLEALSPTSRDGSNCLSPDGMDCTTNQTSGHAINLPALTSLAQSRPLYCHDYALMDTLEAGRLDTVAALESQIHDTCVSIFFVLSLI